MSPIQSASWRVLALLGTAGAMACSDARPTAPDAIPSRSTLSLTTADGIALAGALADLQTRIAPALGDSSSARRLDAALGRVSAAISARDRVALESSLADGDAALDALTAAVNGAAPQDRDVVRLVLAQGRALLSAPAAGPLSSSPSATTARGTR